MFKSFYESLATDLVNKLPLPTNKFNQEKVKEYYKPLNIEGKNFTLKPTTYDIVLKLLEKINPNKSVGIDNLGGRFLRDGAKVLAKSITEIFNLSVEKSVFPDKCKIAKLKPLYKKGSKLEPKNYRPISLLPIVSKICSKTNLCIIKHRIIWINIKSFTNTNLVFVQNILLTHVSVY